MPCFGRILNCDSYHFQMSSTNSYCLPYLSPCRCTSTEEDAEASFFCWHKNCLKCSSVYYLYFGEHIARSRSNLGYRRCSLRYKINVHSFQICCSPCWSHSWSWVHNVLRTKHPFGNLLRSCCVAAGVCTYFGHDTASNHGVSDEQDLIAGSLGWMAGESRCICEDRAGNLPLVVGT